MTTETILTYSQIEELRLKHGYFEDFARAIEQAVLQSPEIQALRRDAGRYLWLRDDNAYAPEENYIRGGDSLDKYIDAAMEQQI